MLYTRTPVAGFRDPRQFAAIVSCIPSTVAPWAGEEGPRWRLTLSPGGIQIGTRDLGRIERSTEERRVRGLLAAVSRREAFSAAAVPFAPDARLAERIARVSTRAAAAAAADPERALAIRLGAIQRINRLWRDNSRMVMTAESGAPTRGKITEWSRKSRARMARTLTQLDYSQLLGPTSTPGMLTVTLPGRWLEVAPTPDAWKAIVKRFRDRYRTAFGRDLACVSKLEFQRRGAPHLHMLIDVPQVTTPRPLDRSESAHVKRCRRENCDNPAHVREPLTFEQWAAGAWALAVDASRECDRPSCDHQDVERCDSEFKRNLRAGTRLDVDLSQRYGDARRVAVYFAKHGAFAEKEYQNSLPPAWVEAIEQDEASGARLWSHPGVPAVRETVEVDASLIICIMSDQQ